ncbi:MAG: hypothetical protein ACK559_28835, partial [bacterium]
GMCGGYRLGARSRHRSSCCGRCNDRCARGAMPARAARSHDPGLPQHPQLLLVDAQSRQHPGRVGADRARRAVDGPAVAIYHERGQRQIHPSTRLPGRDRHVGDE